MLRPTIRPMQRANNRKSKFGFDRGRCVFLFEPKMENRITSNHKL